MARIISVSNDPLLLRTRALMLEGEHCSVTSCLGVRQALDRLEGAHEFDVLLLGHTLKLQECLEIARVARRHNPLLQIIFIGSGESHEDEMREAGFLVCNSSPRQLLAKIREASASANSASAG